MSDLVVIAFLSEARTEEVRKKVVEMQKGDLFEVGDAVIATRDEKGHVKLNQLIHATGIGEASGAMWGLIGGQDGVRWRYRPEAEGRLGGTRGGGVLRRARHRWWTIPSLAAAGLLGACNANEYVTSAAGPKDPNSQTIFTLAVLPDSVSGCIMADPSMTRPMTVTVKDDKAVLLTSGGIHYDLTRVAPQVYAGGYWVKIRADLSVTPRRLTISTDDRSCNWMATSP